MAEKVAERLDTDPTMLQFFKVQSVRDMVGAVIRSNFDGQVKDLLQVFILYKYSVFSHLIVYGYFKFFLISML